MFINNVETDNFYDGYPSQSKSVVTQLNSTALLLVHLWTKSSQLPNSKMLAVPKVLRHCISDDNFCNRNRYLLPRIAYHN